ncbi:dihydropteroate synthase [Calothrix sp. UHCC 0171]|uniref:dihydropteroate synthase n=1 Tax=Calothrix sp. UHCC 0171 TaxID=3110245 RepID=UPI002B220B54|nr:dihydropteroate synthase [Calothrix sp. UHCC 0171]MEA5569692.1 dihydropteroate synthase [Calothrix sp. UHCC 0171]
MKIRNSTFAWGKRTYIMGVLNVTPDSFSDGGNFNTIDAAIAQAKSMVDAGVDIIDIGGQSTRPGAEQITLREEINRIIPVLAAVRSLTNIAISVDTTRAEVARAAIASGADIINDISGGTFEPELLKVVADAGLPIVLMHIRGTPQTMQQQRNTDYEDVIAAIISFLEKQITKALEIGIEREKIIIDPGIGFAKNLEQNLEIFRRLPELRTLNCPILVGASRKSFIGHILNQPNPQERIWGTAAACCAAIFKGADIIRVHDVKEMRDVSLVTDGICRR